MTDDKHLHPEEQQLLREAPQPVQAQALQAQVHYAQGVACPKCGTLNDADAQYCSSCGSALHVHQCPDCGSDLDDGADFCEVCHHYVRKDVCSFCGAHIGEADGYCPECGAPRGGIVCPTCHSLNDFSFCKQCGKPLTDDARALMARMRELPEYKELVALSSEYNELQMEMPCTTEAEKARQEAAQQLRERVLTLLARDQGVDNVVVPPARQPMTKDELEASRQRKLDQLAELLDRMAAPPSASPAKVRNYAMAQKPAGVRLAWLCNYKNALHSSPCGCAKPQLGGKWVVLGHNSKKEIKDDK